MLIVFFFCVWHSVVLVASGFMSFLSVIADCVSPRALVDGNCFNVEINAAYQSSEIGSAVISKLISVTF
jgi:hypothetical protein